MSNPLNTGNSTSQNYAQVNDLMREVKNSQVTQLFKDETGTRRVLLGKGADGFYGLRVSREGYDVYSASDAELIFDSGNDGLRVVVSGSFNAGVNGLSTAASQYATSSNTTIVPHGLSYTPVIVLARTTDGRAFPYRRITQISTTGYMQHELQIQWDATNIYFIDTAFGFNSGDTVSDVAGTYYVLA